LHGAIYNIIRNIISLSFAIIVPALCTLLEAGSTCPVSGKIDIPQGGRRNSIKSIADEFVEYEDYIAAFTIYDVLVREVIEHFNRDSL